MYNSLFDRIDSDLYHQKPPVEMGFDGTLDDVLDSLYSSNLNSDAEIMSRIHMAPRVLRSAIDINTDIRKVPKLINSAIRFLESAYTTDSISELVDSYASILKQFSINPKDFSVSQASDQASWFAYNPELTISTLDEIDSGYSLYLVCLAHGGLGPGMDLFLRLKDRNPYSDMDFYPVRFSRMKKQDSSPRLSSKSERDLINSNSAGKEIVIFDEDSNTGLSLALAKEYFEKHFPERIISTAVNCVSPSLHFSKAVNFNNC